MNNIEEIREACFSVIGANELLDLVVKEGYECSTSLKVIATQIEKSTNKIFHLLEEMERNGS